jgi:hypothetical protein
LSKDPSRIWRLENQQNRPENSVASHTRSKTDNSKTFFYSLPDHLPIPEKLPSSIHPIKTDPIKTEDLKFEDNLDDYHFELIFPNVDFIHPHIEHFDPEMEAEVGDAPPPPPPAPIVIPDASASFINPAFFSGKTNEDARSWLNYLINWVAYKNMPPATQVNLFPLLFRDGAADWFEALAPGDKDTLEHLQTAFETRYFPTDLKRWQIMSDMWSRKQRIGEPVDDYVTEVRKMARIANVDNEDTERYAAIKGMLPEIRRYVLQQQPENLVDMITAAKVAEQSLQTDDRSDMALAVTRIEAKLNALNMEKTTPSSQPAQPGAQDRRDSPYRNNRSPSPFAIGDRFNNPSSSNSFARSTSNNQRQSNDYWKPDSYRQRPTTGMQQRVAHQANRSEWLYEPPRQQQPWSGRHQQSFRGRNNSGYRPKRVTFQDHQTNYPNCQRCGVPGHNQGICPSRNVLCFKCNLKGHYSRMCRSARPWQPAN